MKRTILARLDQHARIRPGSPAYRHKTADRWVATAWMAYREAVDRAARGLIACGVGRGERVAVLASNRPEWAIFSLGAMAAGATPVGVYTTSSADQVAYILDHAECRVLLVEGRAQVPAAAAGTERLRELRRVVAIDEPRSDAEVLSWCDFMASGDRRSDRQLAERREAIRPEHVAALIYTSGTTGPPKGAMLSHANLYQTARIGCHDLGLRASDRTVSYLPLSHIAEQMTSVYMAIYAGYRVDYVRQPELLVDALRDCRPTLFLGVPRVWERLQRGIAERVSATPRAGRLLDWSASVGRRSAERHNRGGRPSALLALQDRLAHRLLRSSIQHGLGLDRARLCLSGAAPIAGETLAFFAGIGITILEVYGETENCGPATWNRPGAARFGTVGTPLPGVDVRLAEDGEVLIRGPNVFLGYFKDPGATEGALRDGWLHTGDLGRFDDEGFLVIVGRKKEILITSGGKNVAPANLESALCQLDLIAEAMVVGDRRPYLTALLSLDEEVVERQGLTAGDIVDHPDVIAQVQARIDEVNRRLARAERIRKFRILPRRLSIAEGELTPTLKLRRRAIEERWSELIETMYREPGRVRARA